jgi:hypothetical protein
MQTTPDLRVLFNIEIAVPAFGSPLLYAQNDRHPALLIYGLHAKKRRS